METRFLIFSLENEYFGIPISKVREIIRHEGLTAVHDAVSCVRGVINLRGKIITIFDMRERIGLPVRPYDRYTVIIICEVVSRTNHAFLIGMAVDAVLEVTAVPDGSVRAAENLGLTIQGDYLRGIIQGSQGLTQLLEIDRLIQDSSLPVPAAETGTPAP